MILVDTSVWIDFFRGADTVFRRTLRELIETEEDICLTSIHLTEVLQGIKSEIEFQQTRRHLLMFPVLTINDTDTYIHAANIYRLCRQRGTTVRKTVDCIIAAAAIENNLTLMHNDRDFDRIAECIKLK